MKQQFPHLRVVGSEGWESDFVAPLDVEWIDAIFEEPVDTARESTPQMTDMNREEVKARLEASEARMASLAESIRADNAAARADLAVGLRDIKGIGESIKSEASVFYADAARTLADIHRAHASNKAETYALGYKVVTWVFGTLLALTSVGLAAYKVWHDLQAGP